MFNNIFVANVLGLLAFGSCILAFYPTISRVTKQYLPSKNFILKVAHFGVLLSIFFGLVHGLIMTQKTAIDFYDLHTYWVYGAGLFTLNLLIFLAFSFKELTTEFKKLNYFTYAGLFLLICHLII